jgi:hypothetical protein
VRFIAFDLDNTILDYRTSLHQLKLDRAELNKISAHTKADFRLRVIAEFGEDYWTELQGFLYTEYVAYSRIDPKFVDLLKYLGANQWQTSIISHKTKFPYLGPKLNMRDCALKRLEVAGIEKLLTNGVHFFATKEEKIDYINSVKPNIYIDDLEEILDLLSNKITRLLFSSSSPESTSKYNLVYDWCSVYKYLEVEA